MKVTPVSITIFARNITDSSLELWMQERCEDGPLNGLLEFPGGKIEADENPCQAGVREVQEEVGLKMNPADASLFKIYTHEYEDRCVSLFSHLVLKTYALDSAGWQKIVYADEGKQLEGRVPQVNIEIIADICTYLNELRQNGTLEELWAI